MKPIKGFSKLNKEEKIDFLVNHVFKGDKNAKKTLLSFWHNNPDSQKIFDEFSENTLSNYYFPYGIVPNVHLNGKIYCVPMVIEESSVVAAAAKASNFWLKRGGFHAEVQGTTKVGQVHMIWPGNPEDLQKLFNDKKVELLNQMVAPLTVNMEKRGGGLTNIELRDKTDLEPGYYQIWCEFETCDAMGANFINTVLEAIGHSFKEMVRKAFNGPDSDLQIVMAILSNFTPNCRVKAWVECPIEDLNDPAHGMGPQEFAEKFARAVRIAKIDISRATTHNKGIYNGIDAVILATGNDFRAIEACGHTYASRHGRYQGLTDCFIENGMFRFELDIPMSLGTVGGLTTLHPLAKLALDMLGRPSARELMMIVATTGLAQNFAALRSLTTSGIQRGHMKMHLMNILNQFSATEEERIKAKAYFEKDMISFQSVRDYLTQLRDVQ